LGGLPCQHQTRKSGRREQSDTDVAETWEAHQDGGQRATGNESDPDLPEKVRSGVSALRLHIVREVLRQIVVYQSREDFDDSDRQPCDHDDVTNFEAMLQGIRQPVRNIEFWKDHRNRDQKKHQSRDLLGVRDDLFCNNAVPPQREAAKKRVENVMGNMRYRHRRKQPGKSYKPRLSFGVQVSHKVSLTLAMLPVVRQRSLSILHESGPLCSTYHGVRTESGRRSAADCRKTEECVDALAGSVSRPVLNLLGNLSLNLNQWTGLIRGVRSRLPAVGRPEFGA
jgi:hypothetical protein